MGRGKEIEYKGIKYSSIKKACEALGLPHTTIRKRIRTGWTIEKALSIPVITRDSNTTVVYNEKEYSSKKQLCNELGVNYDAVIKRMSDYGYSLEDAVTKNIKGKNERIVEYNGKTYASISDLCKKYGIKKHIIYSRMSKGMTLEEAMSKPIKERNYELEYKGKKYSCLKDLCKKIGAPYSLVCRRVNDGWSLEDALNTPVRHEIEYRGKKYPSIKALCMENDVDCTVVYSRLEAGWTLERALNTPEGICPNAKEVVYNGETFKSISSLCRKYGLNISRVTTRVKRGMSIKDAVETPDIVSQGKPCVYNEKKYRSIKNLCEQLGFNYDIILRRINSGWTLERAINTPGKSNKIEVVYNGEKYQSISKLCEKYGANYYIVGERIRNGMSIEEAMNTPVENTEISYKGKTYKSFTKLCKAYGMNRTTVSSRMKLGLPLEDSLNVPAKNMSKEIVYKGKTYLSIAELSRAYGVSEINLRNRIYKGWSVEEALFCPISFSLGEYRVKQVLDELSEVYFHDKTVKRIFTELNLLDKYDEFIDTLIFEFQKNGHNWSRHRIAALRYDFAVIRKEQIYLFIEFDGKQHFQFVNLFFKTFEHFLYRHNADEIKNSASEIKKIPLLRIRFDQVDYCKEMIMDALDNPYKYLEQHNTYLTNEEYWDIFENIEESALNYA